MLQIIGWILCLLLFVKSLEILGNPAFKDNDLGLTNGAANVAVWVSILGALIFAVMLFMQGKALENNISGYSDINTSIEMSTDEAIKAAEEAMRAAEQ